MDKNNNGSSTEPDIYVPGYNGSSTEPNIYVPGYNGSSTEPNLGLFSKNIPLSGV